MFQTFYQPTHDAKYILGRWKSARGSEVPPISLEESENVLDGENKERFLKFIRSMLGWLPEQRKRASELLKDPWLEGAIP